MQSYYKYILFYRYPGENIARAFQFNDWRQYWNCCDLGAVCLEVFKANSYARSLCTQVNTHPADISVEHFRLLVEDHPFGQLVHCEPQAA